MENYKFFAGGKWHEPSSGVYFDSYNPATGEVWAQIPDCNSDDVNLAVDAAYKAFSQGAWPALTATGRGRLVRRIGEALASHAERLATIETRDNGKRTCDILPGLSTWLVDSFDYYAGLADKIEGSVIPVDVPGIHNYTRHEPYGVIGAITAWNSPLLIAIWKLAPILAAGNTVVIKPSEHASASTLELMKAFEDADLPPGLINVVTGYGTSVGAPLVEHPKVRKISFTGSIEGGRTVAALAAQQIKGVTMELGGKSPQVVFNDANLEDTANGVASGIFPPAGQSCIAGSRLLAQADVHDEVVERIIRVAAKARLGDPADPTTHIGPIANKMQFKRILSHIANAKEDGARLVLGGNSREISGGWFIEPTIFTDVTPDMRIAREEVFGPVLAVIKFETEDEALQIANDTMFGLAAGVWTEDYRRAHRLAAAIEAGTVYINNYFNACTQSPVGGFKQSGYGRENGWEGMTDFMQTKSVWLSTQSGSSDPFPD